MKKRRQTEPAELVGDPVARDGEESRVRRSDLGVAGGGRIAVESRLDVLGELRTRGGQSREEAIHHRSSFDARRQRQVPEDPSKLSGKGRQLRAQRRTIALVQHEPQHALGPGDHHLAVGKALGRRLGERISAGRRQGLQHVLEDVSGERDLVLTGDGLGSRIRPLGHGWLLGAPSPEAGRT
jgi:hypothetical protein